MQEQDAVSELLKDITIKKLLIAEVFTRALKELKQDSSSNIHNYVNLPSSLKTNDGCRSPT